jgi:hypothetical protein
MASAGHPPGGGSLAGIGMGDLFALANALASMVGGPVTIEDPSSRVLAYSSLDDPLDEARRQTILGRRVPDQWLQRLIDDGAFKRLWSTDGVIRIEELGGESIERLAIAVRAGGEILGSIWVARGLHPLDETTEVALEEAARIAALHLVHHRAGDDLERRARGDALRMLFAGRGDAVVNTARLGVDPQARLVVLAVELDASDEDLLGSRRERLVSLVSTYCEAYRVGSVVAPVDGVVYVLLSPFDGELSSVDRLAKDIAERHAPSAGVRVRVGIGAIVDGTRLLPASRAGADDVLRVLRTFQRPERVAHIDSLRPQALLLELADHAPGLRHLADGRLAVLAEHDENHGTEYVETLRAYLNAFGDVASASASLPIHRNTFRYRLRRLQEIASLDLSDPIERLSLELQLRLR